MIYCTIIAAAALGTAALAQPLASSSAAQAAAPEAPDPARREAARRLVDASMPPGWIEQLVHIIGSQAGVGESPADARQARRDRHFAERTRLTRAAIEAEMLRVVREEEPEFRAVMADLFARRIPLENLEAANLFYSSPAGQRLMAGALALASDPDYLAAVSYETGPLGAAMMERVVRRFTEETASLPPLSDEDQGAAPARVEAGVQPARPVARPRTSAAADPERLAAAQRALDVMWTPEAMGVPVNIDPVLDAVLAMPVSAFGFPIPPEWDIRPDQTVAQVAARFDPAFRERLRIGLRIWSEEMSRSNVETAPIYRRILADSYARHFTVAELDEFTRFFSTPAGTHLRDASLSMYEDPQFVAYLARLLPRLLTQIAPAYERIAAATAHLPPPPAPRRDRRRRRD